MVIRDALAKLAVAAVSAGVPVDELWPEHRGIGVRINEAFGSPSVRGKCNAV